MRETLVAIALLAAPPTFAQAPDQPPGYGVVESVVPFSRAEESASAGASVARPSAGKKAQPGYLIRVRMDDGSTQVRSVKRAEVKPGQRALITNAGDVVPE
jgi:hypothetical protein